MTLSNIVICKHSTVIIKPITKPDTAFFLANFPKSRNSSAQIPLHYYARRHQGVRMQNTSIAITFL